MSKHISVNHKQTSNIFNGYVIGNLCHGEKRAGAMLFGEST